MRTLVLLSLVAALSYAQDDARREKARAVIAARDADGDGRLTSAELKAGDDLFALLDRDGDGFLAAEELAGPRVRRRLPADADGDGRISREEFRGPTELFDRLDADRDGFLSAEEAEAARRGVARRAGRRGEPGAALLERADRDGDGKISREEWPLRPEHFDRFDRNGDGFLAGDELKPRGRERMERDEAPLARILERDDENADGKVSRDEYAGPAARFERLDANHDGVLEAADGS